MENEGKNTFSTEIPEEEQLQRITDQENYEEKTTGKDLTEEEAEKIFNAVEKIDISQQIAIDQTTGKEIPWRLPGDLSTDRAFVYDHAVVVFSDGTGKVYLTYDTSIVPALYRLGYKHSEDHEVPFTYNSVPEDPDTAKKFRDMQKKAGWDLEEE